MHANPIADPSTLDGTHDAVILDLLLIEHDGLWSIDELERMLGDTVAVADALARLHALGLIHKIETSSAQPAPPPTSTQSPPSSHAHTGVVHRRRSASPEATAPRAPTDENTQ